MLCNDTRLRLERRRRDDFHNCRNVRAPRADCGLGFLNACMAAELSHPAGHAARAAGAGRLQRPVGAHARGAVAGALGPGGRDRQSAGRRQQPRRGRGRARRSRRLHADDRHRRADDLECPPLQELAVRSGEGLRADNHRRRQHHLPRCQCGAAGEDNAGVDRPTPGPIQASCNTARPAPARRIIFPASCSR